MEIELLVEDEDNPKSYIFFRDEEGNKLPPGKWEETDDDGWVCKLDVVPRSMLKAAFSQIDELKKSNEDLKSLRAQQAREIAELERRNNECETLILERDRAIVDAEEMAKDITDLHIQIIGLKAERDRLLGTNSKFRAMGHVNLLWPEQPNEEEDRDKLDRNTIASLQSQIHKTAVEHGWWEPQQILQAQEPGGGDELQPYNGQIFAQRSFGDLVALMHSELSEALEAYRERGLEKWVVYKREANRTSNAIRELHVPGDGRFIVNGKEISQDAFHELMVAEGSAKPEGAFVELADCIIRILDAAEFYEVDMQALVLEKMAYNETREYRHGGKKL